MKPGLVISAGCAAVLTGIGLWFFSTEPTGGIRPDDAEQVAMGETLYARECASCHGRDRQGQSPNWRQRLPDGTLAAPPHDATGHTWHHPDSMLFEITKFGRLKAAKTYVKSDMPAFGNKLSDKEIWAVLSYIKSEWPTEIQQRHDHLNKRYSSSR